MGWKQAQGYHWQESLKLSQTHQTQHHNGATSKQFTTHKSCGNCGKRYHQSNNSQYLARGVTCREFGKLNHFAEKYRSKTAHNMSICHQGFDYNGSDSQAAALIHLQTSLDYS
ncbi:hypothetical protein CHS0354_014415 [Potamilus streckersoni]|uniref:Uncharacterized protein n=1 Tax=Potamilus streckersoni TaxID=2493646 RepID=A0AAE0S9I4_9BIVA|nr:hypothetical protein CHS0354_014415 [Potamilus streckersoni]